ncbi:hypothetical protein O7623_16275 [Solwaraspora sp. WMMD791]|uniref:hypothetical protein n=1 Tax=Solwaraspora sp. WMMD791 TaxID=3016086 RepID=UPI00249C5C8E|nr:hypothetical protein [Solwaraspora sp. WMMD791]WFE24982.1 hypothetical protein O7623_16275 [Solwaraspora sp. WMMD791]
MRAPGKLVRRLTTATLAGTLLLTAGCQNIADAGQTIQPADLVNELATRLGGADDLTYSAEYQLVGGASASIVQAQNPQRTAYVYPGGKLIVTSAATTECDTTSDRPVCTLTAGPSPSAPPQPELFSDANAGGLVTPPVVIALLNATAVDPAAVVTQNDTTIAGRHATCVTVRQVQGAAAPRFDVCVTTEGALGSFTGVVDGQAVEIAISRYSDTVDDTAFELPDGARSVDRRPGPA